MLLLKQHAKALAEKLSLLQASRYKILVLSYKFGPDRTTLVKEVCRSVGGRYIDISSQLLPFIDRPVLGAYGPGDLLHWMDDQSHQSDQIVCFDEIESLLATFGKVGAARFLEILKNLETSQPAIVATYLENELAKANFPKERVYQVRG